MTEASASASAPEARNSIAIVAILSAIAFVCYMDRQLIAVLAQPIKHELGLSDSEIGFISGLAFAIFYAGLGIPLARLADRWSRAAVLSLAVAFWTMCNMASGLAASFSQLLFARIGVASGEAACVPASHAIIGERVPAKHRTFAISVFHTCGAAGIMFGSMLGGWVAAHYGWRQAFLVVSAPGLVVAIFAWFLLKGSQGRRPAEDEGGSSNGLLASLGALARRSTFINLTIGYSLSSFGIQAIGQWSAAFFIRNHGLDVGEAGFWIGITNGLASLIGILGGGWLAGRLSRRDRRWELWLPAWTSIAAVPLFIAALWVPSLSLVLGLVLIATLVWYMGMAPGLGAIQSIIESKLRATAVACTLVTTAILGQGCGPFVTGLISDRLAGSTGDQSLRIALTVSTVTFLWSAFHMLRAAKTFRSELLS